eukprot:TRINITY_DN6018_c0_g1_i4.p1 TRINITY_DN6018_c0_g1~~TRINITY_DN6018_c0_g1_i4.p1  ORF type:complete len:143 (+),score=20.73 TRINITY_DN6018_c0_g1_i4:1542-1970(+)
MEFLRFHSLFMGAQMSDHNHRNIEVKRKIFDNWHLLSLLEKRHFATLYGIKTWVGDVPHLVRVSAAAKSSYPAIRKIQMATENKNVDSSEGSEWQLRTRMLIRAKDRKKDRKRKSPQLLKARNREAINHPITKALSKRDNLG